MSRKVFITGTGTDIGKTYVAGLVLKKLAENGINAAYYKAAVSGNDRDKSGKLVPGDALHVKTVSGISQPLEQMCPYIYENAVSPHLASRIEGNPVKLSRVVEGFNVLCEKYDYVTMEGSGGILCPLCFDEEKINLPDVIKECGLSCILVADAGLGTINDVGLTASYMRAERIELNGIILNNFIPGNVLHEDNLKMCEYITGVKVVACVKRGDTSLDISPEKLKSLYR